MDKQPTLGADVVVLTKSAARKRARKLSKKAARRRIVELDESVSPRKVASLSKKKARKKVAKLEIKMAKKVGTYGCAPDSLSQLPKRQRPKTECCVSRQRCQRCPIRMLAEGTLPQGYTVKKRKLVKAA